MKLFENKEILKLIELTTGRVIDENCLEVCKSLYVPTTIEELKVDPFKKHLSWMVDVEARQGTYFQDMIDFKLDCGLRGCTVTLRDMLDFIEDQIQEAEIDEIDVSEKVDKTYKLMLETRFGSMVIDW